MGRLSNRVRILIILLALPVVCVGFIRFALWRSNQISPAFLSAGQAAYRSIRECDDTISEEDLYFVPCIKKASDMVEVVRKTAITQREGLEYAFLHGYVNQVDDCHRDRRSSDESTDAKARLEQLALIRNHMDRIYKYS